MAIAVTVANSRWPGGKAPADPPTFKTTVVARSATPLPAPISGESVVATPGGPLILGGQVLIFGGGTETSTDAVQALPAPGGTVASGTTARQVGRLPTVRSDLSAVALGGRIYAFGGETVSGGVSDAIREVDPRAGTARVVGHLPQALSHASAVFLGGRIYILGGEIGGSPSDAIWRFDPAGGRVVAAGRLPVAVSGGAATTVGSTAYLIGETGAGEAALPTIVTLAVHSEKVAPKTESKPQSASSTGASYPFAGRLMIADRGNDRLLVVNAPKQVLWSFPSRAHPAPPGGFYFPDDAFFIHGGTGIISNEEQNERIVQLALPSGKLLWLFTAAGLMTVPLIPLTAAFFAGRLVSYSVYVSVASVAQQNLGSLVLDSLTSPLGVAVQLLMLVGVTLLAGGLPKPRGRGARTARHRPQRK